MQVAVALELLLMRPIRRADLVDLRLGEHVVQIGGKTIIVVDGAEVKNRVDLEHALPAESARTLDFYVRHLLPLFGDNPMVWLAPALLHHADRRIAERHYDQARDASAVAMWQMHVREQRARTATWRSRDSR